MNPRRSATIVRLSLLAALLATTASFSGLAAAQKIGVASAVNPQATGTPPDGAMRLIQVGLDMQRNERISTGPAGRTQLLFLDGSALTVGPDSNMVLDELVYDPETKTGKIALNVTKGLFRFVGGRISKQGGVQIKTPTALIGIRGGIGIVEVKPLEQSASRSKDGLSAGAEGTQQIAQAQPQQPASVTTATLAFGQMTVRTDAGETRITRPGFRVMVTSADAPPGQPAPAPAQESNQAQQGLEGSGENAGGPERQPTNEDVAGTQISQLGSQRQPVQLAPAPAGGNPPPPVGEGLPPAPEDDTRNAQQDMATSAGSNTSPSTTLGGGRYLRQTPFTAFDFNTGQTTSVAANNQTFSSGTLSGGYFTASLSNGSVMLPASTGTFSVSSGSSPFGAVTGTGFGASDSSFFYWTLKETAQGNNPASLFAGKAFDTTQLPTSGTNIYDLAAGFPGTNATPMLEAMYGGNISGALASRLYVAWSANNTSFSGDARSTALFGSIAINGTGSSQSSAMVTYTGAFFSGSTTNNKVVLGGYSRGSVRMTATGTPIRVDGGGGGSSLDGAGNAIFGSAGPDYLVIGSDHYLTGSLERVTAAGFVQTIENPSSPATTFFTESYAKKSQSTLGQARTSRSLNGYVSGLATVRVGSSTPSVYVLNTASSTPNSVSITTNATTNRLVAQFNTQDALSSNDSLQIPFGGLTGSGGGRSAFISDFTFGARESSAVTPLVGGQSASARIGLLTSTFVNPSSSALAGNSLCNCGYVQWGFISGELSGSTSRHRLHLVPWVAGELSNTADLAGMTGTATYTGHAVANIMNGTSQYIAFGAYSQNWNFSSRTGTVSISNLDGATYSGSLSEVTASGGRDFMGSISGSSRSGSLQGSFVKGGPVAAGELAAQFQVTGSSYYAAGIAAARLP